MSRLALGSAQFGLSYGITNPHGQVARSEVAAILDLAASKGIDTIDSARLYGASEEVIGHCWPTAADFRIVTKTPKFTACTSDEQAFRQLTQGLDESLGALGRSSVYGLLLHDAQDLLGPLGPSLWTALETFKRSGRAAKIGVSVYEPEEIDRILALYPIDLIQLPFNALDRRLAEGGQLAKLRAAGVEVHARSIFLQGLLLSPANQIAARMDPVRSALEKFDIAFAGHGLTRLEGLLASVLAYPEIDRLVVGVTSAAELGAIVAAADRAAKAPPVQLAVEALDPRYLNPARWHELG